MAGGAPDTRFPPLIGELDALGVALRREQLVELSCVALEEPRLT